MKNFLKATVVGLAGLVAFAGLLPQIPLSPVNAQTLTSGGVQIVPFRSLPAVEIFTAVVTQPAIYVKYVGTAAGAATVAVAAGGDVTVVANGAADATINAAGTVCGATPGTLDLSTPAAGCDTLGEVVDLFNASPNWVASLHGGLRSDSSDNTLNTLVTADAKNPAGLALINDQAVTLQMTVTLIPKTTGPITGFPGLAPGSDPGITAYTSGNKVIPNPFADRTTTLLYAHENITTTDNAANLFRVLCVIPSSKAGTSTTGTAVPVGSESVIELYREAAAATTVTGKIDEFVNAGGLECPGGKLLVRVNGNTTLTAPVLFGTGFVRFKQ